MNVNLDSENLQLKENADLSREDSKEWYDSYGAHISTEKCGDITAFELTHDGENWSVNNGKVSK